MAEHCLYQSLNTMNLTTMQFCMYSMHALSEDAVRARWCPHDESLLPAFPPKEQSHSWRRGSKDTDGQTGIHFQCRATRWLLFRSRHRTKPSLGSKRSQSAFGQRYRALHPVTAGGKMMPCGQKQGLTCKDSAICREKNKEKKNGGARSRHQSSAPGRSC